MKSMRMIIVDRLETAFEIANDYAPEHLLLEIREPRRWLGRVSAAGAVFLGHWSPESVGDYCSGPNHTLPTHGFARAYGGLALEDYQKRITVQELSPPGLSDLGPTAQILAHLEGLDAHAAAVNVRLAAIEQAAGTAVVSLARPEIVTLKAYAHADWRPTLTRLHANEAPWRPSGDATTAGLNRYPEPQPVLLIRQLAALYGVPEESVLATRGSDEAIDLLSRIYLRAGTDAILQCSPSFGMYQVAARIQGAEVIEVPLERERSWALDPERLLAAWRPNVKLVYLCSPNNPTANLLDAAALEHLCRALDGKAIVVIDEAYIEWSRSSSLTPWLARFSTLAILRTLSKAHALAGARIGALLANPESHRIGEARDCALLPGATHGGGSFARAGSRRACRRPGTARGPAGGARLPGARPRRLALGGPGLAKRCQFPAHRLRCRSLHEPRAGRRPDRPRPARPPRAAALVARFGRHPRAERRIAA